MNNLEKSLKVIGQNKVLRDKFISFIKDVESELHYEGSIRDGVTKYLIDALFEENDYIIKPIQNGLKYKFHTGIGSKVAREFLLSSPEIPEYAWEPQTTKLLLYLAKSAKTVIVGGAYFGDQVIPVADLIQKNNGKVYAFDLNELQIETLRFNAEINKLSNIISEYQGLWKDSRTFLDISDSDDLAFATPVEGNAISNTITIDEYLKNNEIPFVDLIMLDVEGSEYNILLGAEKQLSRHDNYPNIVFEVHRSYMDWTNGLRETDLIKYLERFGYHIFSVRDFQGNYDMKGTPIELIAPEKTVIDGPPHGFNMLAIKDLNLIDNDMFRIVENVSPKYLLHKEPKIHHPIGGFKK